MSSMGLQAGHEEGWPINLERHDGLSFKVAKRSLELINCPCFEIDGTHELAPVSDKHRRTLLAQIHVECFGGLRGFVLELDDLGMEHVSEAIATPFVTMTMCKDV